MLKTSKRLRHISPILYAFERLFAVFSLLSIADALFGPREDFNNYQTTVGKIKATVRRGKQIEGYITTCLVLEFIFAWLIFGAPEFFTLFLIFIFCYRIFEIMQAQLNLNVFSPLRSHGRHSRVESPIRTVVLSLLNFFEVIVCFGALYSSNCCLLKGATNWYDPYYFSVVTQMTIGYGDIAPLEEFRIVVALQAICGFIMAVIVIGRLVAFLPKAKPVFGGRVENNRRQTTIKSD